jgi:hypothetical protein
LKAYANAAGMPAPIGIPAPVDAEARRVQSQRMENLYIHIMTEKINAALVK